MTENFIKYVRSRDCLIVLTLFVFVFLTRYEVLQSTWCLDDWGLLANASGLIKSGDRIGARWFSQDFYWALTYPLFGLNPFLYSISRILLHFLAVWGVFRLSRKLGLPEFHSVLGAVLFAATPTVFTVLVWASGIQELLAVSAAVWSVVFWFGGTKAARMGCLSLGLISIFSKESALALPLLFLLLLAWNHRNLRRDRSAWAVVFLLIVASVAESVLVQAHFETGKLAAYEASFGQTMAANLGTFAWWLGTPGPIFTGQMTWMRVFAGLLGLFVWLVVSIGAWRRGNRIPFFSLGVVLLSIAPALPLVNQARPYMAYLAAAPVAVTFVSFLPIRIRFSWLQLCIVTLVLGAVVNLSMGYRWHRKNENGTYADSVILGLESARAPTRTVLQGLAESRGMDIEQVVVVQQPLEASFGAPGFKPPADIKKSVAYESLAGELGLQVLAGPGKSVKWTTSFRGISTNSRVFCEKGGGLEDWGSSWNALANASLVDLLLGNMDLAIAEILEAAKIDADWSEYRYDHRQLELPMEVMFKRLNTLQNGVQMQFENSSRTQWERDAIFDFVTAVRSQFDKVN